MKKFTKIVKIIVVPFFKEFHFVFDYLNYLANIIFSSGMEHSKMIRGLCYSPRVNKIATGSWDKTLKVFTKAGSTLAHLTEHTKRVNACCFTPNGDQLVSGMNTISRNLTG